MSASLASRLEIAARGYPDPRRIEEGCRVWILEAKVAERLSVELATHRRDTHLCRLAPGAGGVLNHAALEIGKFTHAHRQLIPLQRLHLEHRDSPYRRHHRDQRYRSEDSDRDDRCDSTLPRHRAVACGSALTRCDEVVEIVERTISRSVQQPPTVGRHRTVGGIESPCSNGNRDQELLAAPGVASGIRLVVAVGTGERPVRHLHLSSGGNPQSIHADDRQRAISAGSTTFLREGEQPPRDGLKRHVRHVEARERLPLDVLVGIPALRAGSAGSQPPESLRPVEVASSRRDRRLVWCRNAHPHLPLEALVANERERRIFRKSADNSIRPDRFRRLQRGRRLLGDLRSCGLNRCRPFPGSRAGQQLMDPAVAVRSPCRHEEQHRDANTDRTRGHHEIGTVRYLHRGRHAESREDEASARRRRTERDARAVVAPDTNPAQQLAQRPAQPVPGTAK